ncbi:peptidase inhibitor family I36 protein [Catenuloplanes japonicus]|uniref:peptidase inhibitor family I36 protein n=1 Tax=Catenuloplanes japonicus TaxID=33876 RepID=UPI000ABBC66E|nr:peptidase inhibitor family I36 protein [Catenuloplanes japonicus]
MKKVITSLFAGLSLVAAALVMSPSSASAGLNDCDRGAFCAWSNDGFSGTIREWQGSSSNWGSMNDDAESVFNNALSSSTVPDNVNVYDDVDYRGFDICVLPGETYDAGMDDNDYSSHLWVHSC